jgi:hypothetical protein
VDLASLRGWFKWGESARSGKANGRGVTFWQDDYKFTALLKHPGRLLDFGPPVVVEPNFSTTPDLPRYEALHRIGLKRNLAAQWGAAGVKLIVDLNVDPAFRDLTLLGVPAGWSSYATRKQEGMTGADLEADFGLAARHAGLGGTDAASVDLLIFIVFGGGAKVRALCVDHRWGWVPEPSHVARGIAFRPVPVGGE